jgi:anti-anti-sigma factor
VPAEAIQVRREGDVSIVSLTGEHDLSTAQALREALESARATSGGLIVDLSHADFIDSSILGLIVSAWQEAGATGARFALIVGNGSGSSVRRVLELTDLGSTLPVHPDLAHAIAACAEPTAS